ncbi:MAG: hypothetical protein NTX17_03190 [Candidatus Eisenbacteria bacterium]|nr:hypothetical protein [Candidatus Eisenbacteria bacterium]
MEKKKVDFEDVFFSEKDADSVSSLDSYEGASSIATDLKVPLLAELELSDAIGTWERDFLLLSESSWVHDCEYVGERLIKLREISPLDIVAVSALTERVILRPFLCSLAVALRKFLQKVVIIDCDLRAPSMHTLVAGEGKEGFIDMVKHGCSFSTVASETEKEGIYIIGAGSHPVSSEGELVGRELERVFHSLRTKADITLACVPPFLIRKQVNPILNCADGVLLCLNDSAGTKGGIRKGFSALWKSDIPVLGIVAQRSSQVDERQTLVLRANAEDDEPLRQQPPSAENAPDSRGSSGTKSSVSSIPTGSVALSEEAVRGTEVVRARETVREGEAARAERQVPGWEPISSTRDATEGEGLLSNEIDSHETTSGEDSEFVERTLFGKQHQWRQYVVGTCVVLGIVGVLALKQASPPGSGSPQMDERMMRSIILPGSDGVTTGDESRGSQAGAVPRSSDVFGFPNDARSATFYVETSLRARHDDAVQDSSRVADVGLRAFTERVDLGGGERGYRVVVGPFLTADGARIAASRIEPLGLSTETRIITEGVKK